jgi:hypothetical protein
VVDYLERLDRALAFDAPLARRVRVEVEDHLLEVLAAEPEGASLEAQRRALVRFGSPRALVGQYAAQSLQRRMRRIGALAIVAVAGVFLAMKARVAWYGLVGWGAAPDLHDLVRVSLLIDRYAFIAAFAIAIAGWAYVGSRRIAGDFHGGCRTQVRRATLLCAAAAAALIASVATDAILTGFRLAAVAPSLAALVPLGAQLAEIALACLLVGQIRGTARSAALAAARLGD